MKEIKNLKLGMISGYSIEKNIASFFLESKNPKNCKEFVTSWLKNSKTLLKK